MNTETLSTLYKRAIQYCVAAYGNGEPDEIHIEQNGGLKAKWWAYSRDYDDYYEYFDVEKLTDDLDAVYNERKKREEEERIKQEAYYKEQQKIREQQEKERRKSEYLKLKKEFE